MKTKHIIYLSTLTLGFTLSSCEPEDDLELPTTVIPTSYNNGVFITNEGTYGSGTGTISFYDRSNGKVSNDIFEAKNIYPLGNVVQSMEIHNGLGYIVVNNASKVEIVDATSFASKGVITGLTNPRYFLGISNDKGYISEWGAGGVAGAIKVVDLNTKTVTSTIAALKGAEKMVKIGNNVYVTCSGGYDTDSVVTVIDATTNAIVNTINVGTNPSGIRVDANGKVWVLCSGKMNSTYTALEKTGKLVRINTSVDTVDLALTFSSTSSQPSNLVLNNSQTTLYYTYEGKVFSHGIASTGLNTTATINRSFYALAIDPSNDYFYGADAGNFSSNGKVIRYNATGTVVDSFAVGVIPGNFCFK